jgi:hypothetical protein
VTNNETGGDLPPPPPEGPSRRAEEPRPPEGGAIPQEPSAPAPSGPVPAGGASHLPPPPPAAPGGPIQPAIGLPGPPLDVGGMIEWSFRSFARHWRQLALIVLVLRGAITFLYLLSGAGPSSAGGGIGVSALVVPGRAEVPSGPRLAALVALAVLDVALVQPAFAAALGRAAIGAYLGEAPSADRSLRYGGRRFGSVLLISVMSGLLLVAVVAPFVLVFVLSTAGSDPELGALLLAVILAIPAVVALVFVGTRLSLVSQAFVAEGCRGRAAIRRSWELTRSRFWRVLGVLLAGSFLAGVVTFAITTVTSKIAPGDGLAPAAVRTVGTVAAQCATAPFVALLAASLFFAVKASKEPFDPASSYARLLRLEPRPREGGR